VTGIGQVAVRVDADAAIGLGHLRRCVTLANQLRIDGFTVRLITGRSLAPAIEPFAGGFGVFTLEEAAGRESAHDERQDAEATLSIIGRHPAGVSWVIVDSYRLGNQWERVIREAGHRVLAIDDYRDRRHHADLLLSDIDAPFDPALNGAASGARELTGPEFALIDPEFRYDDVRQKPGREPRRLLASYGSSDPTDETTKAMQAIRLLRSDPECRARLGTVDVVVGPTNPRAPALSRAAEGIGNVDFHLAPGSLAPLLRGTDLFLTAGGNSMVEALAMRKPCIVTVTSDNQALMVDRLNVRGAIRSLGSHETVDPQGIADAIAATLKDYERVATSVHSRAIFDHLGPARVCRVVKTMSREERCF